MAKITIERDGETHVFEGTITSFDGTTDTVSLRAVDDPWTRNVRTGTGTINLTMKFNNGPVDDVEGKPEMNDIKTWQQGRFAPERGYDLSMEQVAEHEQHERHLVRPGLRENAICHCPDPYHAEWIAKRLNLASRLEELTYDFATGKSDGSEIVALVRQSIDAG